MTLYCILVDLGFFFFPPHKDSWFVCVETKAFVSLFYFLFPFSPLLAASQGISVPSRHQGAPWSRLSQGPSDPAAQGEVLG